MDNVVLSEYERLNNQGKRFVNAAIKAALSTPANLLETPEAELLEIKRQQEETDRKRKLEKERQDKYFEEIQAECENMTKEDYIAKLNAVFGELPTYKLRYFFLFINAKLGYDVEGGA
jgi:HD-GYP domain-containing protein (c-di-GMP phosphodiesterase class II)